MPEIISKRINCLSTKIKREITNLPSIANIDNISGVNSFIIVYIYKNKDVYQKDIEREFGITRSTASNIISLMEKKNFVKRESNDTDGRLKKIVLTDSAINICENFLHDLDELNNDLCKDLTNEELNSLFSILSKVENNLKRRQER